MSCVKDSLKDLRNRIDAFFLKWYELYVELGKEYDIAPSMPRTAQMQQHRNNTLEHLPLVNTTGDLYVDYLSAEMNTFFSAEQMNVSKLISLVPEVS